MNPTLNPLESTMKRLTNLAVFATITLTLTLTLANSAWAGTSITPNSLDAYEKAPAVKMYRDAWAKCGPNGENCPDEKSVAEATRLRKLAVQDCFTKFAANDFDRVDPCRTAVTASPSVFSLKIGGNPVKSVKPPKSIKQPEAQPEPVKPPEQPEPVIAAKPPEPVKPPEPQPEPVKPPEPQPEPVKPPEPDVGTKVVTDVTPPQPPTPLDNQPGWLWPIFMMIVLLIVYHFGKGWNDKRKAVKPAEAPSPENVENFITRDELEVELRKALKEFLLSEVEARILQEKSTSFTVQLATEEQTLNTLKDATPRDEVEIKRVESRMGNLDFLAKEATSTANRLISLLKDKSALKDKAIKKPT